MPDPRPLPPEDPTDRLIGHAPAIQALRTQIHQLPAFDAVGRPSVPTVLLHGETGTGKGLVARVLHDSGPRARGPFIDVNCAAIPETMLEAELFGFEAGAFTDAKRAKAGLFEAASGGTLFLDEIDALPLVLQSKLLKILEEKRVRRLGAVADRAVDVKLIAATSADLPARVAEGRFRTWPEASALEAPPHEPWTVVARWEQVIVEKARGFGGVVVQHAPSLLLVAFGIPQTLEQQPQRAVYAALALRQLVADEEPVARGRVAPRAAAGTALGAPAGRHPGPRAAAACAGGGGDPGVGGHGASGRTLVYIPAVYRRGGHRAFDFRQCLRHHRGTVGAVITGWTGPQAPAPIRGSHARTGSP